ncbi:beta-ketoacyl-[acyl-carrier-protein] synthase family protein [Tengunoibacter tsumagoiensis]|uniref:3-oxoacyl-[acyl-carrier-protein] synthase 2 n=1 Tax=Tengunoibacter tsumagoiensis TaxID=2014871 RepID=A0A402A459_9CHLR|nr:beta-ketoacyl-[acyl-carrier-protein] synthase family protein [Tengunoibacter tsumagoiensis]GCE13791.1 3-oxoacyl-[acyl-carrier-protein] synthase 2 [Tengunoibacter tsumagoiensis]
MVVTGLGVVAPNGIGQKKFWDALLTGRSGMSLLQESSIGSLQVAGLVRDFVAQDHLTSKLVQRTDRMTHFAFAAIHEALEDARLVFEQENRACIGLSIANTMGGVDYVLKQLQNLYTRGPRFMSAYTAIAWLHVSTVGQAAIHYGVQGYCKTPVNDTVGGLDALGLAYRAILRGTADVMIAGGCEAFLHPFVLLILAQQGHCVTSTDLAGYRPFDRRAQGLILAEGAGICILEEYEHALARGAPIYGEIIGYGQSNDALGLQAPGRDGARYAQALCQALQAELIEAPDLAYLSLDGRASIPSDQGEHNALSRLFGSQLPQIPVSVPRTLFGHAYAAAGALDAIIAFLALKHGQIPPTFNCEQLDERYELNVIRGEAQAIRSRDGERLPDTVLLGGRGLGGINVGLALRRFRE